MEDYQDLLSTIDGLKDIETSQYAQDIDQALCYRCGAQKLVELHRSHRSLDFTPSINHCRGW